MVVIVAKQLEYVVLLVLALALVSWLLCVVVSTGAALIYFALSIHPGECRNKGK